jgi:hypothetical protein
LVAVYSLILITHVRVRSKDVGCDVCGGQIGRVILLCDRVIRFSFILPLFSPPFLAGTIDTSVFRSLRIPRIAENRRDLLLLFGFVENDVTILYNIIYPFFVR